MNNIIKIISNKIAYLGFKYAPKLSIKTIYRIKMKRKLNLNNPTSFSEKMNYLNLYDKNPLSSKCADKFMVREYIQQKGYNEYLVKLLNVYDNVDEIDFDILPNKFAMKCNHGCGYNIICTDKSKLDIKNSKKLLNKWMKEKYGYRGGEYHYNDIEPKIIVEEYIEGIDSNSLPIDYKIHCFNGKPAFILCCTNRESGLKLAVYDMEWNKMDVVIDKYKTDIIIDKPHDFDKMISISKSIAKDFKIVRVDFYELKNKALLGEITCTPAAGRPNYFKESFDKQIGEIIKIN